MNELEDDHSEKSDLQTLKAQREIEKLDLEIDRIGKWYSNPLIALFISMATPILIVILGFMLNTPLEIRKANLELQETILNERAKQIANDTLILISKIDSLKHGYGQLLQESDSLKTENTKWVNNNNQLEKQYTNLQQKNNRTEDANKELNSTMKRMDLTSILSTMDTLGNEFNPTSKIYAQLKQTLKKAERPENDKIIESYANNGKKALNNRLTLILAAYSVYKDPFLLNKFIKTLDLDALQIYCDDPKNFQNVIPVLKSDNLNPEEYHLAVSSFLSQLRSKKCLSKSLEMLNDLLLDKRPDTKLAPDKDIDAYLNYIGLVRESIFLNSSFLHPKSASEGGKVMRTIATEKIPKIVRAVFVAEYRKHIDTVAQDFFLGVTFQDLTSVKDLGDLNYQNFYLASFWANWETKNAEIVTRFMEPNLDTYRRNESLLLQDIKESDISIKRIRK